MHYASICSCCIYHCARVIHLNSERTFGGVRNPKMVHTTESKKSHTIWPGPFTFVARIHRSKIENTQIDVNKSETRAVKAVRSPLCRLFAANMYANIFGSTREKLPWLCRARSCIRIAYIRAIFHFFAVFHFVNGVTSLVCIGFGGILLFYLES